MANEVGYVNCLGGSLGIGAQLFVHKCYEDGRLGANSFEFVFLRLYGRLETDEDNAFGLVNIRKTAGMILRNRFTYKMREQIFWILFVGGCFIAHT